MTANRMLGSLASYSMITLTDDTISVHRLVQAVLRSTQTDQTESGLTSAAAVAVDLLDSGVPDDPDVDMTGWPRWWSLLPAYPCSR